MSIIIKQVGREQRVYQNRKLVGTLRKFCCGIDFRPKHNPLALFSILKVKFGEKRLIKCIDALLNIEIPNEQFHWNFSYEIASNKDKLAEYKTSLLNLTNDRIQSQPTIV